MFGKFSLLAILAAPLVSALTLLAPDNPTSGGTVTIKWTPTADDQTFSLELINVIFNNAFAIANNVDPASQQITLTLPVVPTGAGYTLHAVNIGNISDIYASSPEFSIGPPSSSTSSGSRTATGVASSTTSTGTRSALSRTSTTGISTVVASTNTGSSTGTQSAAGTTPSAINSGSTRLDFKIGGITAAAFSIIAGAAILAL